MKVALVYDRVNKWGGAERVLLAMHKIFPEASLFTSVYNPKTAPWAREFRIVSSFLQHIPLSLKHELLAPLMPLVFESFDFEGYDLVISITSEAAKGVIVRPPTKHVCLCLTPTRYLWSGYDEYFANGFLRVLAWPVVLYLRFWDKIASSRPDKFIAISQEVKKRIERYYDRESEVIYPPVTLGSRLEVRGSRENYTPNKEMYFLVVSRLSRFTSYKRVDLAIKAATKLGLALKIVGEGEIEYFSSFAGPTVEFLGRVSDKQLMFLYENCQALVFPGYEDFGLVMVEAQAGGSPVIAYRKGGALEIVREGKTGEFFDRQSVASLCEVLKKFDKRRYNSRDCRASAERFSFSNFEKAISLFVQKCDL